MKYLIAFIAGMLISITVNAYAETIKINNEISASVAENPCNVAVQHAKEVCSFYK